MPGCRCGVKRTDLLVGDRAKHRNGSWGTVIDRKRQGNGTTEYRVMPDRSIFGEGFEPRPTWWASYHLDEWSHRTD